MLGVGCGESGREVIWPVLSLGWPGSGGQARHSPEGMLRSR